MTWPLCLSLRVAVLSLLAAGAGAQIPKPRDAPPPLAPEESARAFVVRDGFELQLVASEPLIASPSGICWDERGRMFVTELHGYNLEGELEIRELNKTGKLDTQVRRVEAAEEFKQAAKRQSFGVVKMLSDRDGDGRMDEAVVWAADLPPAYGLVPARQGVIVACAPDIVYLGDHDGDGKPEVREVLFTGFPTGALERGINTPQWSEDGWIYFGRGWGGGTIRGPKLAQPVPHTHADFRIRADGTAIEAVTGGTGTFGFAFTETGDRFLVAPTTPGMFVAPLPARYLARNPNVATPRLTLSTGDKRAYPVAPPHPWRTHRAEHAGFSKFYRDRYGAAESDATGWFTGVCGPLVYRDSVLPGLRGQYLVCEPAGSLIHRARVVADGSALRLERIAGEEQAEFVASRDPWSHPIFLTHGPDGAIWVVDYYREIIEDYSAIPRHLQQQYGLYAGHDRGRIYRLTHRDAAKAPPSDLSRFDTAALVRELGSPLLWRRQTAQRLLLERRPEGAAAAVQAWLSDAAPPPAGIIIGLHTLAQLGALEPDGIVPYLAHPEVAVRVQAWQLADRLFAAPGGDRLVERLLAAARTEQEPRVIIQLALCLGETRDPRAFAELVRLARDRSSIRWMETALLSSLPGRSAEMLAALLPLPSPPAGLVAELARSIGAGGDREEMTRTLALVAKAAPEVQAEILAPLAQGRRQALRRRFEDPAVDRVLAELRNSPAPRVRAAAAALEAALVAVPAGTETQPGEPASRPAMEVSEARFREFVAALAIPRNVRDGHAVFQQACAACHRVGSEGFEFGPDLLGEAGVAEETMLRHILLPNERIRPGYETTRIDLKNGERLLGILRDQSPTSLVLALPGGQELTVLRKDVSAVNPVSGSMMPSFAEAVTPQQAAHLVAWLRSQAGRAR